MAMMPPFRFSAWLVVLFALAAAITAAGAQNADGDAKLLAGTWVVVAAEDGGKKAEPLIGARVVIAGNTLTLKIGEPAGGLHFRLDPTKTPKQIDFEKSKDETLRGIYALNGDTLKLCFNTGSEKRPATFETTKGSSHRLMVLKRDKPE
jgi:uncharacterized protein (TIGR03067 family)